MRLVLICNRELFVFVRLAPAAATRCKPASAAAVGIVGARDPPHCRRGRGDLTPGSPMPMPTSPPARPVSILGPTLETARLWLRPTAAEDFERWAQFCADERAMRWLGGVQSRALAWRTFATMAGSWATRGYGMYSLLDKASGRWLGRVGPWMPEGWPGTEVGWGLHPEAQGRGYAHEAAVAAIDWAFDALGWTEVIHNIDPGNEPSAALARRLGSRVLRTARMPAPFEGMEVEVWGQTREEWRARRG